MTSNLTLTISEWDPVYQRQPNPVLPIRMDYYGRNASSDPVLR